MKGFQYKVIKHYFRSPDRLEAELNQYGLQGWEAAGIGQKMGSMIIILKRPVTIVAQKGSEDQIKF
ncbi:hypothetical protein ISS30_05960 [bacterium]|nr:hypothetical protein [bacterium]